MAQPSTAPLLITSEEFAALAPEWAALHAAIPGATPFTHPEWYATWLRHFGRGIEPVYLGLRDGEDLVGVAALEIGPEGARQLGDHNVTDYSGPLVAPGHEEEAAAGIVEWLIEDMTSTLSFWGIAADSPLRGALASGAARFGWSCREEHEAVCPRAVLPGDFENYLAALSKHDRHELRRKLRNLGSSGEVQFQTLTAADEVNERMERFLQLMRQSKEGKDEFLSGSMEAYFRDLAVTFARLGMLRLGELTLDGRDAAMILCFENEETLFLYNSGYEPELNRLAVGLLSKALALQDAVARGKRHFDFLRGDEEYKRHLGGEPVEVLRLLLHAP